MIRMSRQPHRSTRLPLLVLVLLCCSAAHAAAADKSVADTFRDDLRQLTSAPHRLAGTPQGQQAADYIEKRLQSLGLNRIVRHRFSIPQTVVETCTIEVVTDASGGPQTHPLLPLRPNGIVPPATPTAGLRGPLIHVAQGDFSRLSRRSIEGAIVVLDYASEQAWRKAFRLGARAVVFVNADQATAQDALHTEANVNLPRYYYPGAPQDLVPDSTAVIHCSVHWRASIGESVYALVPGTQPIYHLERDETFVLAAALDSFGEVPRLSPGARGAANCAALLRLATELAENPPRRHVLLAFLDGRSRGHAGATALYRALQNGTGERTAHLETRRTAHQREIRFLAALDEALAEPAPLATKSEVAHRLGILVDQRAEAHARELSHSLGELRQQAAGLPSGDPRRTRIRERIQELVDEKDAWNNLRRALVTDSSHAGLEDKLQKAFAEIRKDAAQRQAELSLEGEALASDEALVHLVGDHWLVLHTTLLLGDASPSWGVAVGGDSCFHNDKETPGVYGRVFNAFLTSWQERRASASPPQHFVPETVDGSLPDPRLFLPATAVTHGGEVAGKLAVQNLILTTSQERFAREGTPRDTVASLNLVNVLSQAEDVCRLLPAVIDHEGLSSRSAFVDDFEFFLPTFTADHAWTGPRAMGKDPGSSLFNRPMSKAVVQICHTPRREPTAEIRAIPAFENYQAVMTNSAGAFTYGPVRKNSRNWNFVDGFAAAFNEAGELTWASNEQSQGQAYSRLEMLPAHSGCLVLPPRARPGTHVSVTMLNALANGRLQAEKSYTRTHDGLAYWYVEEKTERIKLFQTDGVVALENGGPWPSPKDEPKYANGMGFPLEEGWELFDATRRSGSDLWRLDEARLQVQRRCNVINTSIEELHWRVRDTLDTAAETGNLGAQHALTLSSYWGEKPVYKHTRAALDDLVKAVLVLLALSVPFAFALERLLLGATTIYRQILGFVAFFTLTFLALYVSHPAFAISNTPLIIFLGFTVVILSTLVIVILMRKFETELKVLQGLTSTVHAADVSRFGTVMAAMSMGISTMRRRPVRTALTATTIILLTFTILCFASFDSRMGIVTLFNGPNPRYSGLFVNDVEWKPLDEELLDLLRERDIALPAGDRPLAACPRYWISPQVERGGGLVASKPDGSQPLLLGGVLGISLAELSQRPDLAELLDAQTLADGVYMTTSTADRLGVRAGDTFLVNGETLTVAPPLDGTRLTSQRDLNGESILPVDFSAKADEQQGNQQQAQLEGMDAALQAKGSWTYLPVDSILLVSAKTASRIGAKLHGIAVYTDSADDAAALAEELARILPFPLSATREDGTYLHALGPVLAASGAQDLVFPILLGGLVVFGTMLGSVTDRQKEIYTFSALGLAPPHVASLFFAEALVYSVVGGLGGYLLAQASLKVLTFLSQYQLVAVPEMNYSSTNAIVTILIVMGTVLISAIYPAVQASKSANPGVLRSWDLPRPDGDIYQIAFPFTVSEYDITGVVSFLLEHFENYQDVGLGVFMARDTRLVFDDGAHSVGLESRLALAPFDLGVTERFLLRSQPSEIEGIDEVSIEIERLSGQPRDWARLNKTLLDDLRRQFLIWRSVPQETMEEYRQRTLTAMAAAKAKRPN